MYNVCVVVCEHNTSAQVMEPHYDKFVEKEIQDKPLVKHRKLNFAFIDMQNVSNRVSRELA